MQRFLNDTSQLARNLQQTKDEKDRVLQVLELMEEKMKAEIAKRDRKVCWLRCIIMVNFHRKMVYGLVEVMFLHYVVNWQ